MPCDRVSQKERQAAEKLLDFARQRLSRLNPVLLRSVYALRARHRDQPGPMSTDGRFLYYNTRQLIQDFRADPDDPARQLLHVTLHCLLGHLPDRRGRNRTSLFDALADLKVSALGVSLVGSPFLYPGRVLSPDAQIPLLEKDSLSQLYALARRRPPLLKKVMQQSKVARLDDHRLWEPPVQVSIQLPEVMWQQLALETRQRLSSGPSFGEESLAIRLLEEQEISIRDSGISYRQLLEKLAAPREALRLDPDSWDVRWYTLGLELYGNVPLVEPDEISDRPQTDDLVIALDTSGSCDGRICANFLRETSSLLQQIVEANRSFRVLLLQCDCELQQELLVDSPEQLDRLLEDFSPIGGGGTDFRPVFDRVEELREAGTLSNIQGLIYFTDAEGDFPDQAPDYPVHLLLPDEDDTDFSTTDIPPWANTHLLDPYNHTLKEVIA